MDCVLGIGFVVLTELFLIGFSIQARLLDCIHCLDWVWGSVLLSSTGMQTYSIHRASRKHIA